MICRSVPMINTYTLSIKDRVGDRRHFPNTLGAEAIAPNTGEIGVERRRLLKESAATGFLDHFYL